MAYACQAGRQAGTQASKQGQRLTDQILMRKHGTPIGVQWNVGSSKCGALKPFSPSKSCYTLQQLHPAVCGIRDLSSSSSRREAWA